MQRPGLGKPCVLDAVRFWNFPELVTPSLALPRWRTGQEILPESRLWSSTSSNPWRFSTQPPKTKSGESTKASRAKRGTASRLFWVSSDLSHTMIIT